MDAVLTAARVRIDQAGHDPSYAEVTTFEGASAGYAAVALHLLMQRPRSTSGYAILTPVAEPSKESSDAGAPRAPIDVTRLELPPLRPLGTWVGAPAAGADARVRYQRVPPATAARFDLPGDGLVVRADAAAPVVEPDVATAFVRHPEYGCISVQRFVPGPHLVGRLTETDADKLTALFARMRRPRVLRTAEAFDAYADRFIDGPEPDAARFRAFLRRRPDVLSLISRKDAVSFIDPHRHNIVFGRDRATLIDEKMVFLGPRLLGVACQLAVGVLLYEPADVNRWPTRLGLDSASPTERAEIQALACVRLLIGLCYFDSIGERGSPIWRTYDRVFGEVSASV